MNDLNTQNEFFFETPALKGLIQQLAHLAFFGDGISLVVGEKGSGKTTLAGKLPEHFEQAYSVATLSLNDDVELTECVEQVSRALGVINDEAPSVGEMLAGLRHYIQSLSQDKKLAVLIIDDAHFLDEQSIAALISLLQGSAEANVGLHLVLLSTPGLERRIDSLQVIDVALYDFELPAFSPSELSSFIAARQQTDLDSGEIQRIWVATRGNPGAALKLVEIDDSSDEKKSWSLPSVPIAHLLAIAALVIVLVWSLIFRGGKEAEPETQVIPVAPERSESLGNAGRETISRPQPDTVETEIRQQPVTEESELSVDSGVSADQNRFAESPSATGGAAVLDTPLLNKPSKDIATDKALTPAADPGTTVIREALPGEATPTARGDIEVSEAFLLAQESTHFVLQVIATSKKESLDDFIARQPNRDSLYLYRVQRNGQRWFVVVQGPYSSREAALLSRDTLPEEQTKGGPWPRTLSSIQDEIETYRRSNR